jgi:2-hydroxychromene-2-carboxylate isomerase
VEPVTSLAAFADRRESFDPPTEFFFDLASPFCYLAAERVERLFGMLTWTPAVLPPAGTSPQCVRAQAQERAAALRLPMVWPPRWPAPVPAAMRAAVAATAKGRGAAFTLAAFRLAFAGGHDLDSPDVLAEALAAAGLDPTPPTDFPGADTKISVVSRRLLTAGIIRLPAVRVGSTMFWGDDELDLAAAAAARVSDDAPGRTAAAE